MNAYSENRRRTHASIDAYVSKSLTKRDEIRVSFDVSPSEFRRNYLAGADALGAPIYTEGRPTSLEGEVAYNRRLIGGSGPDLDVEIGVTGGSRSVPGLEWRDRSQLGLSIEFDAKLNRMVKVKLGITRTHLQVELQVIAQVEEDAEDAGALDEKRRFDAVQAVVEGRVPLLSAAANGPALHWLLSL